jgi:glucose-1-phosphate thymidylyltransferase
MKGIILAGGLATRLRPLTYVTNKHLLPIYNQPMIYYPLQAMQKAGIKEVLLTTSADHAGHFATLLKAGENFNLRLYYAIQENPTGGIANAIMLAKEFAKNEQVLVILGDNIFSHNLKPVIDDFESKAKGAIIFGMRQKENLSQYGIIEMDEKSGKVVAVEEKPENPKGDIIQTGIYLYDKHIFENISKLKPSPRGQLEVSDLNNIYAKEGTLKCQLIDWWIDAGTSPDELLRASNLVYEKKKKKLI